MARSSSTTSNQTITNLNKFLQTSFTFAATVKFNRSNSLLWHKQVLTSIKGNFLEGFITEPQIIPEQYLSNLAVDGSTEKIEKSTYFNRQV